MSDPELSDYEEEQEFGQIENHRTGEGQVKVERVTMALAGNIAPYEKKTSMFITLSGESMHEILKSLTQPKKPSEVEYDEAFHTKG